MNTITKRSLYQKIALSTFYLFSLLFVNQNTSAENERLPLVITIQPDGTLNGSYTKDEYSIFFEAFRGEENSTEDDTDIQPYALDIRVLDNNKNPFLVKNSGVADDIDWLDIENTGEDREKAMAMLPGAIGELKEIYINFGSNEENTDQITGVSEDNKWELWALIELMRSAVEDISSNITEGEKYPQIMDKKKSYRLKMNVAIMRKSVVSSLFAEHSALLVKVYNSKNKRIGTLVSCNHGTCADNSKKMSKKCSKNFYDYLPQITDLICDKYGIPYSLTKYFHVCNNDTKVQYSYFKNKGFPNYSYCLSRLRYAPDCD